MCILQCAIEFDRNSGLLTVGRYQFICVQMHSLLTLFVGSLICIRSLNLCRQQQLKLVASGRNIFMESALVLLRSTNRAQLTALLLDLEHPNN